MKKESRIYVAGHTGLIGSAIIRRLIADGYKNLILKSHNELDLTDQKKVEGFFKKEKPEHVFICAGKTGGIYANIKYPADFIYYNTIISTNLIYYSFLYNVKKLLYIGCSCMYPKFCKQPMKEDYLLTGKIEETNEPYAIAKIMGLKMCQAYNKQYKTKFITVIGSNAYGPGERQFNEESHVIPFLIKKFYTAQKEKLHRVEIWGTGLARRDFIYVDDIAKACILLMENYEGKETINVGTGKGENIRKIVKILKKISNFKGQIIYNKKMPDGAPVRILNIDRIKKLGWEPEYSLYDGLRTTYQWYIETYGK